MMWFINDTLLPSRQETLHQSWDSSGLLTQPPFILNLISHLQGFFFLENYCHFEGCPELPGKPWACSHFESHSYVY